MFKFFKQRVDCDEKQSAKIGMTEFVGIANRYFEVPAKIDTGADSSSIWASNIRIADDDALEFTLFDETSPLYDGHVFRVAKEEYEVTVLRNSTGDKHYRYRVYLSLKLGARKIRASFTLADRAKNGMPVLIGRSTISNKFLVDVSLNPTGRRRRYKKEAEKLTAEMNKDPKSFHKKYKLGKD